MVHRFRSALLPWRGWQWAAQDALSLYDADFAGQATGRRAFITFIVIALLFWTVYVPVHEFLHVAGCLLAGGRVDEMVIGQGIGGNYWAKVFSFIVVEPGFGGRISRFDPGSDLGYLFTDILPYVLTPLGIFLIRRSAQRVRIALVGPAVIMGFAPFLNLLGDYYEMGSIIVTAPLIQLGGLAAAKELRSDDLIGLIGGFASNPAVPAVGTPAALALVAGGGITGLALAGWVYGISCAAFPPAVRRTAPEPQREAA